MKRLILRGPSHVKCLYFEDECCNLDDVLRFDVANRVFFLRFGPPWRSVRTNPQRLRALAEFMQEHLQGRTRKIRIAGAEAFVLPGDVREDDEIMQKGDAK